VYQVVHKKTGFLFALKKMKKSSIKKDKMQDQIMQEIKMQLYFDHPNILKLYGIIE
jgi:serine/threonine protein kinase